MNNITYINNISTFRAAVASRGEIIIHDCVSWKWLVFHVTFSTTNSTELTIPSSIYTGPVLGWASYPSETISSVHPCNSKGMKSSRYKYIDHGLTNDLHPLQLLFHPIPVRLYVLCVDLTGRVNIVQCVAHDTVRVHWWELLYTVTCMHMLPTHHVYSIPCSDMLLYDG